MIAINVILARLKAVKRVLAIFCCLLFAGQMFAQTLPECAVSGPRISACPHCKGMCGMKCCAAKQSSQYPTTPPRSALQSQILIAVLAVMASTPTPTQSAKQDFSFADSSSHPGAVPIFQRDCAILI